MSARVSREAAVELQAMALDGGLKEMPREFAERMTRPMPVEGNARIQYTREAVEQHVEGLMLVQCVITTDGQPTNLKVIKPLPFMVDQVLATLETWRFTPATLDGKPVAVKYVLPIRLVFPKPAPDAGT